MEKKQRTTIWLSPDVMNSLDDIKSKAKVNSLNRQYSFTNSNINFTNPFLGENGKLYKL